MNKQYIYDAILDLLKAKDRLSKTDGTKVIDDFIDILVTKYSIKKIDLCIYNAEYIKQTILYTNIKETIKDHEFILYNRVNGIEARLIKEH